LSVLAAV